MVGLNFHLSQQGLGGRGWKVYNMKNLLHSLPCTHTHTHLSISHRHKHRRTDLHQQHTHIPPTEYSFTQSMPHTYTVLMSLSCQSLDSIPPQFILLWYLLVRRGELSIRTFPQWEERKEITVDCKVEREMSECLRSWWGHWMPAKANLPDSMY